MASLIRNSQTQSTPIRYRSSCLPQSAKSHMLPSRSIIPAYCQCQRSFYTSNRLNATFDNLARLSQSRETGYYSKATGRSRTAFSSNLQLMKAEAEAVPDAVGFSKTPKASVSSNKSTIPTPPPASTPEQLIQPVIDAQNDAMAEETTVVKELREAHKMVKRQHETLSKSNQELRVANQRLRILERRETGSWYERARALTFGLVFGTLGFVVVGNVLILIVGVLLNNELSQRIRVLEDKERTGQEVAAEGMVEFEEDELAQLAAQLAVEDDFEELGVAGETEETLSQAELPSPGEERKPRSLRSRLFWATPKQ
ncbi:uncharacterized protein KY384_000808 [Bacidia gigantensis]|uniref:uncharacterized protein n=1 Tax=Bacidia gigantensis TaxID=2732470 RepID=UPI001D03BF27|nr:uncharacterized protein KY384_000808 [Bacidia gigantensis]KAG8526046.1 hypothetical protein KY384_000808 [Bacidia gigantensis]